MSFSSQNQILSVLLVLVSGLVIGSSSDLCSESGSCATPVDGHHHHHHSCDHHHHHDGHRNKETTMLLPEELAEEEDMRLYGFGPYLHHDHDHDRHHHPQLSGLALWWRALGCSLLVSLASLICLIILPLIFIQGKPSRAVVDSLALFGAGAMLGDAFLHQLPHSFGGEHSHSHDHHKHGRQVQSGLEHQHSHSHSLKDLSVGISVLAGIVLFLIVEKVVRYVQENSGEAISGGHGHHHHHHKSNKKLKDDSDIHAEKEPESSSVKERVSDEISEDTLNGDKFTEPEAHIRKRKISSAGGDDKLNVNAVDGSSTDLKSMEKKESAQSSNLVFGYLNLFSDGVHNFTDGVALGSAFLLYGSVGGWSRTLFLLAHELPQEIGDFGILVRSGFSVSKALFFNFLSALVALVGTAMALLLGQDPGQSSLIEGFTAGGFIYIAIAGVLAEMNNNGSTALKSTAVQLISLIMGMAVALCISLVE